MSDPFFLKLNSFAADIPVVDAAERLQEHANRLGLSIKCKLNDKTVLAFPGDSPTDMRTAWMALQDKTHIEIVTVGHGLQEHERTKVEEANCDPRQIDPEFEAAGEQVHGFMNIMHKNGFSAKDLVSLLEEEVQLWRDRR